MHSIFKELFLIEDEMIYVFLAKVHAASFFGVYVIYRFLPEESAVIKDAARFYYHGAAFIGSHNALV